jgi:hypothetical protein
MMLLMAMMLMMAMMVKRQQEGEGEHSFAYVDNTLIPRLPYYTNELMTWIVDK